jgi:mRNA interferase MazF
MGLPAVRDVVIVPFPFSDSSQSKIRPALCIANAERGEWVLCQITSTGQGDPNALSLGPSDFESGGLAHHSFVRPLKLFTVHERRFIRSVGKLTDAALQRIVDSLIALLRP